VTENTEKQNIATMTSAELEAHIKKLDENHRSRMTSLRALMRARKAEEVSE
jgi:hypothetical protein